MPRTAETPPHLRWKRRLFHCDNSSVRLSVPTTIGFRANTHRMAYVHGQPRIYTNGGDPPSIPFSMDGRRPLTVIRYKTSDDLAELDDLVEIPGNHAGMLQIGGECGHGLLMMVLL